MYISAIRHHARRPQGPNGPLVNAEKLKTLAARKVLIESTGESLLFKEARLTSFPESFARLPFFPPAPQLLLTSSRDSLENRK